MEIDLRGHGESKWSQERRYSLEDYVLDIRTVLEEAALQPFVLVGHSLGGDIAIKLAEARIENLCALVLVDAGPGSDPAGRRHIRDQILESIQVYRDPSQYSAWLQERRYLLTPAMSDRISLGALKKSSTGYELKFDPWVLDILLDDSSDDWWWPALTACTVPTLCVRGIGSAVLPKATFLKMVRSLRHGTGATIRGAGHAVMTDNPEEFTNVVAPFVVSALGRCRRGGIAF